MPILSVFPVENLSAIADLYPEDLRPLFGPPRHEVLRGPLRSVDPTPEPLGEKSLVAGLFPKERETVAQPPVLLLTL